MTPELKAAVERVERDLRDGQGSSEVSNHDLRLILAALAEREWRPIETDPPPRYGPMFDVLVREEMFPRTLHRIADCWRQDDGCGPELDGKIVNWSGSRDTILEVIDAVYWMPIAPLPDGPEPEAPPHLAYLPAEPSKPEPAPAEGPTIAEIKFGYLRKKAFLEEVVGTLQAKQPGERGE